MGAVTMATHAKLWEHFHFHPDQISRLTDRQIIDIAFHAREEGEIKVPVIREPLVPEDGSRRLSNMERDLAALASLQNRLSHVAPENNTVLPFDAKELERKILEKYETGRSEAPPETEEVYKLMAERWKETDK